MPETNREIRHIFGARGQDFLAGPVSFCFPMSTTTKIDKIGKQLIKIIKKNHTPTQGIKMGAYVLPQNLQNKTRLQRGGHFWSPDVRPSSAPLKKYGVNDVRSSCTASSRWDKPWKPRQKSGFGALEGGATVVFCCFVVSLMVGKWWSSIFF